MKRGNNYTGARYLFSNGLRSPRPSAASGLTMSGGSNRPTEIRRTVFTHCSLCGRKLRPKRIQYQAAPNRSFPGSYTEWLNHSRDCRHYGQAPDSVKS